MKSSFLMRCLAATVLLVPLVRAELTTYSTTDPNVADNAPQAAGGDGWAAGGGVAVAAGQTIYLGFLNDENHARSKWLRIEVGVTGGAASQVDLHEAHGYTAAGGQADVYNHAAGLNVAGPGVVHHEFRFTPQPSWERISYTNNNDVPVTLDVHAWSVCCRLRPAFSQIKRLELDGAFGAVAPGAMANAQRIDELYLFPVAAPVDTSAPLSFTPPLGAGAFASSFAFADPLGGPRPGGGARFKTTGAGIAAGASFAAAFSMNSAAIDSFFDVFFHDAAANRWIRQRFDLSLVAPFSYCTAGTSTSGCNASISALTNPSASLANPCTFAVSNVEGQKLGLLFYGVFGPMAAPWCAGGSSVLCVRSPTMRMQLQSSGGSAGACTGSFSVDWNAYITTHPFALGAPFAAGDPMCVQAWYRDPQACQTTNLSDGLLVTFRP